MDETPPQPDRITERTDALAHLREHWEEFYRVYFDLGRWHARRLDNGAVVHAGTPGELDEALRLDFAEKPVSAHGGILP